MIDALLEALMDSLKVLALAFVMFILLSFIENALVQYLKKSKKVGPLMGALAGIVPQCGISVVASDLYIKKAISVGTLIAVFIACSDEALPILLSSPKWYYGFILLGIKFVAGFLVGVVVDLIYFRNKETLTNPEVSESEVHIGCCGHRIGDKENPLHSHLIHPLVHSLKIFIYVLLINIGFALIIYYIGEDSILNFLETNKYLTPLFSIIVGFIPNCASSVILTEFYLVGGMPFSALVAGLTVNAGLGMAYLLKDRKAVKNFPLIIGVLTLTALILGYALIFIN
ncbi:MAG: putative manganese transporter [Bacilli bacterium]